jgi:hypothetical protein
MLLYENWKPLLLITRGGSSLVQNVKNVWWNLVQDDDDEKMEHLIDS